MKALERASSKDIIRLGQELARTESSGIYAIDVPGNAAKIWRHADGARARKLAAMMANAPDDPGAALGLPTIAWPSDLLRESGRTIGYVMPRIGASVPLAVACDPATRRRTLPGLNWHYLHVAAQGVARIVASIHARGYVIGDLGAETFLIDAHGHVAFVGADGIQVRDRTTAAVYRCLAPFDRFAAPELEGRDPAEVDRNETHDRHALALLIARLLLGSAANASGAPDIDVLHPDLQALFLRALDHGRTSPRARPTAEEWVAAFHPAIDDLVPCASEIGHFHASTGDCVWCARRTSLADDVFATPAEISIDTDFIVAHVERALVAGDERHALKLWSRRESGAKVAPAWDSRMTELAGLLGALDRFADHYARDPEDDAGLAQLWLGPPDLSNAVAAHREGIGGETYAAVGARLIAGVAALERLALLAKRSQTDGDAPLTEIGESEIAAVHAEAKRLVSERTLAAHPAAARAAEAEARLKRFADILTGLETADDARVVEAWGDGKLFVRYAPARERHVDIMRTIHRANALMAFERHYRRSPDDDSGLWALWMREPTLAASRLARRPSDALEGRTPVAWAETAERRVAILQGIMQALMRSPPDTRRIAELWDDKLCRGRQAFRTLQTAIDRALAQHDGMTRLLAALAAGVDQPIIDAWSESAHAARPEIAPQLPRIRQAFARRIVDAPAPKEATLGAFETGINHVAIRWIWPAGVDACAIAVRDERPAERWDDVERAQHRQFVRRADAEGQAGLPFRGRDPVVSIWPAVWVGGQPVTARESLRLSRPRRKVLSYRFDEARQIALDIPPGTAIPTLVALGARGRLPVPGDRDAVLLGRIGALASETGGRITLALDPADESDLYVRLYPEDASALAAFALRHPPFRESRIDPG